MKIDLYTKVVLTIIAFCLLILALKHVQAVPKAYANTSTIHTQTTPNYGLVPLNEDGSINVNMSTMDVRIVDINTYDALSVKIKDIDTYESLPVEIKKISTSDELDVNIDEIGGSFLHSGQALPVKIEN